MKSKPGAQINQSIIDGFSVLQALASHDNPVGGSELAKQLGLESTRVNRLLKTLASIGMTQQTRGRKYLPGPGIHVLAAQSLYASGMLRSAIPALESLSALGHTVAMGLLWFDSVSFVYHAKPGMNSAEAIGRIGLRPATTSGIGMALLAASDNEAIEDAYQEREIPKYDDIDSLKHALETIRQQGYARIDVIHEGETDTKHTIAVPLGANTNAAIAVSGTIAEEDTAAIVAALQHAQQDIADAMHSLKGTV